MYKVKNLKYGLIAGLLMLGACTGGAMQTGVDISQDVGLGVIRNVSMDEYNQLVATCKLADPSLNVAVSPSAPKTVADVAVYGAAFCYQIENEGLGNTVTQSSSKWLSDVLVGVDTAAKVAGYVLPVVLPFL